MQGKGDELVQAEIWSLFQRLLFDQKTEIGRFIDRRVAYP